MRTRSIDAKWALPRLGLVVAATLVATLTACNSAQAQERAADAQPSKPTLVATVQSIQPTSVDPGEANGAVDQAISSLTVSANIPESEPWDSFRQSVAAAAAPSCFGPDALAHEEFAVKGLLRLPFLVRAAAASACR
jgi:ABC-type transport system substrate-binding protein